MSKYKFELGATLYNRNYDEPDVVFRGVVMARATVEEVDAVGEPLCHTEYQVSLHIDGTEELDWWHENECFLSADEAFQ